MSFNPGDVLVHRAALAGEGGGLDLTRHFRHFSVFENLKKPYVAFRGQIIDMVDIAAVLNGENWLELSFGQPGQEPYNKTFAITSAQRHHNAHNLREQEIEIVGYSPHMTTFPKIQRAYKNITLTDVVTDLVTTYVQPLLVPFAVEAPSRGIAGTDLMPYNINGVQIHKAIHQSLLRAVSTTDLSSAYVFFENNKRLLVDTLVNLSVKALAANFVGSSKEYVQRPMGLDFETDHALQNRIILSMHEETRIDQTQTVQARTQQSRPYDVFSNEFWRELIGAGEPFSYLNIPYNILRPPTFLAFALPERKRAAAAFDQQSLTIHVALNPAVTVGEGFSAETLVPTSTTMAQPETIKRNYLSTEVRHTVDFTKRRMIGTTTTKGVIGDMGIWG